MVDLGLFSLVASPPPPGGPSLPSGSELLLAGILLAGGAWRFGRVAALRFALLAALFFALMPGASPLDPHLIHAFNWGPAVLMSALGTPATVQGAAIVTADGAWTVVRGCLGLSYVGLFVLAAAAFPMTWRRRLATVALGVSVFVLLNVVRVVTLYGLWQAEAFAAYELLHAGGGVVFTAILVGMGALSARPREA